MGAEDVRIVPRLALALRLAAATCLVWVCLAGPAHAGPVEQLTEVAFGVSGSGSVVARYDNGGGGLIFGDPEKRSWQLQCGSALLAPGETLRGPMLALADGSLLLGSAQGIIALAPDRCGAAPELPTTKGAAVYDLAPDPRDPNAAFALLSVPGSSPTRSTLWHRASDGSWTKLGNDLDAALATSVRATLRDGKLRLYEAAVVSMQDEDAGPRYFVNMVRYSDDGAATFRERTVSADSAPQLIGVDPSNPDRVVLLIDRAGKKDSLLVSDDAGVSFKPYLELAAYGGIAFAPDGRVWIGGSDLMGQSDERDRGLWAASSLASAPEKLASASYGVQCLGYHARTDKLYACQHFWLGEVDTRSGAFTTVLNFTSVSALASCAGAAARCEQQLCRDYCGPAHFAVAPACGAYDTPSCGAPVAARESGEAMTSDEMTPAQMSVGATQPTRAMDGPDASTGRAAATGPSSESGASAREDSGCSAARARRGPEGAGWLLLAALWCGLRRSRLRRGCTGA